MLSAGNKVYFDQKEQNLFQRNSSRLYGLPNLIVGGKTFMGDTVTLIRFVQNSKVLNIPSTLDEKEENIA